MGGVLFGLGPILALQELSSPFLDAFFLVLTSTGDILFFFAVVVLVYWLWDKRLGLFLSVLILTSSALNAYLKALFGWPRPPPVYHKTPFPLTGNGFPSGHAQQTATFWSGAALASRGVWIFVGVGMVIGVSLSRVYLGVHFVGDVLAGAAIGVGVGVAGYVAYRASFWDRFAPTQRLVLAVLLPGALAATLYIVGVAPYLFWGLLTGLSAGYVLEGEWVGMARPRGSDAVVLRIGVGILVVSTLASTGLQLTNPILVSTFFLGLGLVVSLVLPWAFVHLEARLRRANR